MATTIGTSSYRLSVKSPRSSPFTGSDGPAVDSVVPISTGTGANQANLIGVHEFTVAASGNTDIDLRADVKDQDDSALSTLDVPCEIYLKSTGNAAGVVNVTPSASNGLDILGNDIELNDGQECIRRNYATGGLGTVDASNKSLNFANADGTNAATIRIELVGRDT